MTEPTRALERLATRPLLLVAACVAAPQLLPLALGYYGYFIDEFYYYACSDRLAWGYVDHPPFSIFLLWGVRSVLGESLLAARFVAAMIGAATIFIAGCMAWRMGAGRYGQLLAATATACAPVLIAMSGFYSMNTIEVLIWSLCSLLLIEILSSDEPRLWSLFGLVAGIGFMNKHTMVLFLAGLTVGVLLTPQRRVLRERWLWAGVAIAVLIALPNILWQIQHDWASLEFYRGAGSKNLATSPIQATVNQVLSLNPGSLPILGAGVWALLRDRRLRPLGAMFVVLFLMTVFSGLSRQDRIAGLSPLVFAAGAAYWDQSKSRPTRVLVLGMPLVIALALSPVFLPILPPAQLARYSATLGVVPELEAHGTPLALPQWFADRIYWDEYVHAIEDAFAGLPETEKSAAVIFTRSYGAAGPLELLGRGLPPVYSVHNSYHGWGPPGPFDVALVVQISESELSQHFESVIQVAEFQCTYCRQWRNPTPVYAVRRPRRPIAEVWEDLRYFK